MSVYGRKNKVIKMEDTDTLRNVFITSREVLDAIRRGWTPEMINELPAAEVDQLFEKPSADPATSKLIRNIRNAPILPVPRKRWH